MFVLDSLDGDTGHDVVFILIVCWVGVYLLEQNMVRGKRTR